MTTATKEAYDNAKSLNHPENLALAKLLIAELVIQSGIPRDERVKGERIARTRKTWFGLGPERETLVDVYGFHVELDKKDILTVAVTHDDQTDYGLSSYSEFADWDAHRILVELPLAKLLT